ncbi:uncharacterized protein LOC132276090 isoform X2 [Cornus florida]|uniref:uncharacterized protein LOC132276090 isoform X2 n=1 Tax=Cornus florida TaxID=4283 RepID=UPI00289D7448|nr:uncharacterized protein LOC132276090 isoform X2 [Cornus florida]
MVSASYSSTLARGNWDNNGSSQHMGSSSVVTQSGYNFSLPWYRTILDVNIAMFKQRPWRHTGTDITDFFKFWVQRGKLEKLLQLSDKSGLLVHGQQDNYVQRWELSEFIFSVKARIAGAVTFFVAVKFFVWFMKEKLQEDMNNFCFILIK